MKRTFAPSTKKNARSISKAAYLALAAKHPSKYNEQREEEMRGNAWLRAVHGGL